MNNISIVTHRVMMTKVLIDIYKDNSLLNKLGFKGGTACYFFHDLPRFSVDLDFNIINIGDLDESEIGALAQRVTEILTKYGQVENFSRKHNTLFWLLNYQKQQWNLKVEISMRDYQDEFERRELLGIMIPVMKPEHIFAHKLVALTDRNKPVGRDVFDINYFMSKEWKIKSRIIESRTGLEARAYLQTLPDFVSNNFVKKNILDGVGELLDRPSRDYYKAKLLEDVVTNLKILAANYEAYLV